MLGQDEYNEATALPVDLVYAIANSETNQNDAAMMEYMTEVDSVGNGDGAAADGGATGGHISGGSWINQYDESGVDDEEDNDEEHAEYNSLHPSLYTAQHFGISGDDEILEEDNINDIVYGVDNIDVENQHSDDSNDYDIYYCIGLYKFVQIISQSKPDDSTDYVEPDSTINDDIE